MGFGEGALEEMVIKLTDDFFDNRKILVTGATGLVGPWLVEDLIKKNITIGDSSYITTSKMKSF